MMRSVVFLFYFHQKLIKFKKNETEPQKKKEKKKRQGERFRDAFQRNRVVDERKEKKTLLRLRQPQSAFCHLFRGQDGSTRS